MKRRGVLGGGAAAAVAFAPGGAFPQSAPRVVKIGWLAVGVQPWSLELMRATLRRHGFEEGRNLVIHIRATNAGYEGLRELAAELVALEVDVIRTFGDTATRAAVSATSTIPIVMVSGLDPVAAGLVASFTRPGGNLTGIQSFSADLASKRLELLREILPSLRRVGVIYSSDSPGQVALLQESREAASSIGIELDIRAIRGVPDIEPAIAGIAAAGAGALAPVSSTLLFNNAALVADLALRHRLPAAFTARTFVETTGLMSYGSNGREQSERASEMMVRILNGARPAEIPIERGSRFELVLNVRTARALGIEFPMSLLARADEVIE
jgi:putative ABC transport system substrate-binding protein